MNIVIRNEEEKDYRLVEEIARDAFWNLYCPGCDEHFIINKIRKSEDFIKELSFVIELNGNVVGAIFYTNSKIVCNDGTIINTITFAPVFIKSDYHRQGLGKKLINYSIDKAKKLGYKAILILGYPYHYETYGFIGAKNYNICMEDMKFYKCLMALPLYKGALDNISGYVTFSKVFETNQKELSEFDKNFPYKEKNFQQSQIEFEKASSLIDE